MKKFSVSFERVEYITFEIEGKDRADVKKKIKNCEWDLETETIDEVENKNFNIKELKGGNLENE